MTKNVIHKTKQNKHWTCHFEKYKVIKTKETDDWTNDSDVSIQIYTSLTRNFV